MGTNLRSDFQKDELPLDVANDGDIELASVNLADKGIDLRADSHLALDIDTRLDAEATPCHQLPLVLGLEVVDIGPGPMNLLADRVTCSVNEIPTVSGSLDHLTTGIVGVTAATGSAGTNLLTDILEAGVSSSADDVEDLDILLRW